MSYRFDPELAPWIEQLTDTDLSDPMLARQRLRDRIASLPAPTLPGSITVRDSVARMPGAPYDVPVRIYTPNDFDGPRPGYLYVHGGGFVLGGFENAHARVARISASLGVVVVQVDYRLAPEHPFPAPLIDTYTVLEWVTANAAELGIEPGRLVMGGDSAGAALALSASLLARDRNGPEITALMLASPVTDDRLQTPSMRAFHDTPIWTNKSAAASWAHYLAQGTEFDGSDGHHYAAPARSESFAQLPPTYISACEFDPLRDEAIDMATAMLRDGVNVELHVYPGTFHGSTMVGDADISQRMLAEQTAAIARGLGISESAVVQASS